MHASSPSISVNRYLPFAVMYFFVNAVALPFGLTYTSLLAPLFYYWILMTRKQEVLLPFLVAICPFIVMQLWLSEVDKPSYMISILNIVLIYIAAQAVYTFFKVCEEPEYIFNRILQINFLLCLLAIPFYFTNYAGWFWIDQNISTGVGEMRRLQLFTYEPSYYALLFTPVFCFFLLGYLFRRNTIRGIWLLPMLFLPYILSFSIGVISALVLAGLLTWIVWFRKLTSQRRIFTALLNTGVTVFALLTTIAFFFRNNSVFGRLANIIEGKDSSGNGRTSDAFILAGKLLRERNEYWGVGPGQIKIMGHEIIRDYYLYYMEYAAAIPNAAAETLAIFGWTGFILRLAIEIILFFYTRVWSNYYRLLLFFFMFIYQFTGSYITNIAEYVIWILAFTNVFRQFDVNRKPRVIPQQVQ